MRLLKRPIVFALIIFSFFATAIPCGPAFLTPLFKVRNSPEFPYEDFAAGKLGILKPEFHRSVLFVAYRYINQNGFNADEQRDLTDVWKAEFRKTDYRDRDVDDDVKQWIAARKTVIGEDEKTPEIYTEKKYGGFEFFPNCLGDAFRTATETLKARSASHGSEDISVKNWIRAQDTVFENCSSKRSPVAPPDPSMPEWLQKDRAYQSAAAAFYALDYREAKSRFADIALDFTSPWQETADYLVARTIIREASLSGRNEAAIKLYLEAEPILERIVMNSGKFSEAAGDLLGLVKYRARPAERVVELAAKLALPGPNNELRQDLIDYTWLLDKFEADALKNVERQQLTAIVASIGNVDDPNTQLTPEQQRAVQRLKQLNGDEDSGRYSGPKPTATSGEKQPGDIEVRVYSDDYSDNYLLYLSPDASDEEAIAEAEHVIGTPLSDDMKERVRSSRQMAYSGRFGSKRADAYEGGYWGDVDRSSSTVPGFLRRDEMTDWLFTFQLKDDDAYRYALSRYRQMPGDLWLMAAIVKAKPGSEGVDELLAGASQATKTAPAYPTIAYHSARLYIERGDRERAAKTIDEALRWLPNLPLSSSNSFLELRQKLSVTLDEFLYYAQRRAFAFDYGSTVGTIDEIIAEEKSWFNPEYNTEGREAFERDVERRFQDERAMANSTLLSAETTNVVNFYFDSSAMAVAARSPQLPAHLRERFLMAAFTRAVLFDDFPTVQRIGPELTRYHPNLAEPIRFIAIAPTPAAKRDAALYMMLRNPILTPYIEDGLGKTDNDADVWDGNDWWCERYDSFYDEDVGDMRPFSSLPRPPFLTAGQVAAAERERNGLKEIGDAAAHFGDRVLKWAARAPRDARLPEVLYLAHEANGWSKWGCGGGPDLQNKLAAILKTRYPRSEWARKLIAEQQNSN